MIYYFNGRNINRVSSFSSCLLNRTFPWRNCSKDIGRKMRRLIQIEIFSSELTHTRDRYIDPSYHNFKNYLLSSYLSRPLAARPAQAALMDKTWKETIFKIMVGEGSMYLSLEKSSDVICECPLKAPAKCKISFQISIKDLMTSMM